MTNMTDMTDTNTVWVKICTLAQVPENRAMGVNINGQRLVVARCGDEAHVMQGFCSHMLFPLAGAKVDNCALTCSLHRSTFDVHDGSVQAWSTFPPLVGAALAAIRQRNGLHTYETRVSDGDVYLKWPGENADEIRVKV